MFVTATGGPGTSGLDAKDSYTAAFDPSIPQHFDVIFFDQCVGNNFVLFMVSPQRMNGAAACVSTYLGTQMPLACFGDRQLLACCRHPATPSCPRK